MKIVLSLLLVMATMLAGCAAPAPAPAASERAAADATPPTPPKHRPPPMSDPSPPRKAKSVTTVDFSCTRSADCAIKDVGNCCGSLPACVNKDSPTDPAGVRAQCQASGMMSICGFQEISACQCVSGRCEPESSVIGDGPAAR